ncbi:MAG: efflux RND transporter periplasmic adaptor subunit, partial [Atopobium sp.]|nr:efflux RND transporter periplasmic adaptor subunit [Atopobium sp.]
IQHMDNVLTVPLVAVMDDGDGAYVNVVTSRDEKGYPQVKRVPVTVKAQSSTTAVIEGAGIEDGTEVMIGGGAGGPSQGAAMDAPAGATSGSGTSSTSGATSDTTGSKDSK